MMTFRKINKAIIDLLGAKAAGRFSVVGYRRQGVGANEVRGNKRSVQSFFQQGDFPKDSGAAYGAVDHNMTFTLVLTVSAPASADLTVLTSPQSTPVQKAAALAAMQDAGYQADELMDELFDIVWNILMNGENIDLGLPVGTLADRWIGSLKKADPLPQGTLLTLNGEMQYTCRCCEDITGDVGQPMSAGIELTLQVGTDEIAKTMALMGARDMEGGINVTYEGEFVTNEGERVTWRAE